MKGETVLPISYPIKYQTGKWLLPLTAAAAFALSALLMIRPAQAQTTLLSQTFENTADTYSDYYFFNNSTNADSSYAGWYLNNTSSPFASQSGSTYLYSNYEAIASGSSGTISTWFLTPTLTYKNGDVISFYTRTTGNTPIAPDRMQVRFSSSGTSTDIGSSATDLGVFTTQLLEINSGQTTTGYPTSWTQYSITLSGLSGDTAGRVAFRYFVTGGGPAGSYSDFVGLDTLTFTRPAATPEPASAALMMLGVFSIGGSVARRRKRTR